MTLRTVETYVSYQGEGPNTSRPTLFVRFAGCNFKCPGWPCDTQHAIQPSIFTKTQQHWKPSDLAEHILTFGVGNICLTGGEVFLQNKSELQECLSLVKSTEPGVNIECFTNGALEWGTDIPPLIDNFIVDWKLPGSGEQYYGEPFLANVNRLGEEDAIKFTIKDTTDYIEAKRRFEAYSFFQTKHIQVYAGVVWDAMPTDILAQLMLDDDLDWNLNVQVHKFIWHPDKQGV